MPRALAALALTLCVALTAAAPASAVTLESIGDFSDPVGVVSDPSDPDRLFVAQKSGTVRMVEKGVAKTFLDLSQTGLLLAGDETGLLSIALAPDFARSGRLYAFYVRDASGPGPGPHAGDGDLQIDEFTAVGDSVPLASRREVMTIPVLAASDPPASVHNGGQLQFGPDGMLYLTVGDGAFDGTGDPFEVGQDAASLWGKVLRIDPTWAGSDAFTVPADNPFVGGPGADEVWSLGLRNPWRMTFDRLTGAMVIGDVGHHSWEEVNWVPGPGAGRGVNFGWDCREGSHPYDPGPAPCVGLTDPVLEYGHPSAGPASVTSGYVVRDPDLCGLEGRVLYADVFTGEIRSFSPAVRAPSDDAPTGLTVNWPVSFGEDAAGRLYVVSLMHPGFTHGTVYRLVPEDNDCPRPPESQQEATCRGRAATIVSGGRLRGTRGRDVIVGGVGPDRISGGGGRDLICAGAGADRLAGGRGADRLYGQLGSDRLIGGPGADRCRGGPGGDARRGC